MRSEKEIEEALLNIFYDFFGHDYTGRINETTVMDDIPHWDSLNYISLIMEIEKKFNISFSFDEAAQMYAYKKIKAAVLEKVKH